MLRIVSLFFVVTMFLSFETVYAGEHLYGSGNNAYSNIRPNSGYWGGYIFDFVEIQGSPNWRVLETGYYAVIGIKDDGSLWAWGNTLWTPVRQNTPFRVGSAKDWDTVSACEDFYVAKKTDGTIWFGGMTHSFLKNPGSANNYIYYTPRQIGVENNWKLVSAGSNFICAIKNDGTLWAWGQNDNSKLGIPGIPYVEYPLQVGTDSDWQTVCCSKYVTYAVKRDGTLWMWGKFTGYMAGGDSNISIPTRVGTDNDWVTAKAGYRGALAIKKDGSLWYKSDDDRLGPPSREFTKDPYLKNVTSFFNNEDFAVVANGVLRTVRLYGDVVTVEHDDVPPECPWQRASKTIKFTRVFGNNEYFYAFGCPVADTIFAPVAEKAEVCGGRELNVNFTARGYFFPDNKFTVELANRRDNFADPLEIGSCNCPIDSVSGISNLSINCVIPQFVVGDTTYRIRIKSSHDTLYSPYSEADITVLPSPASTVRTNQTSCREKLQDFYVYQTKYSTYDWNVTGGKIVGKANDYEITVLWDDTDTGRVSLLVTSNAGCTSYDSKSFYLNPLPAADFTGNLSAYVSDTIVYVATKKGYGFSWSVSGGRINGNADSSAVSIIWDAGAEHKLTLLAVDPITLCDRIIEKNPSVVDPGEINFPFVSEVCEGDTVKYALPVSTDMKYSWKSVNGEVLGGLDSNVATIYWNAVGMGQLAVKRTLVPSGKSDNKLIPIKVKALPDKPTISRIGKLLNSSSGIGNQWYLNGNALNDSVKAYITPSVNGLYAVRVSEDGCTGPLSDAFNYTFVDVEDNTIGDTFAIYPVPADNRLTVSTGGLAPVCVDIYDIRGVKLSTYGAFGGKFEIDISNFIPGVYFVKCKTEVRVFVKQ